MPEISERRFITFINLWHPASSLYALAFRELEALARALLAVLLTLFRSRVARNKTGLLQTSAKIGIKLDKRARQSVTNCACLTCWPAAVNVDQYVELADRICQMKRLAYDHAMHFVLKVIFKFALINNNLSGAGLDEDSRGRALATARTVILNRFCHY